MVAEFLGINAEPVSTGIACATVSSSDKESSSSVNFKLSISVDESNQKVTSSLSSTKSMYSTPALVNLLRPFNHYNNPHRYHSSLVGFFHNQRGNVLNKRGGTKKKMGFVVIRRFRTIQIHITSLGASMIGIPIGGSIFGQRTHISRFMDLLMVL
uniref:Uncharacterized protein n=1 Tax=Nelumbo nucifera TaxID=4432 RepID=A0A822YKH4_NELNU|nr:TPA_asm: hypothetical protein HUJ06_011858 [Nelumbo nucifera]